jgi:hypothetical protein
VSCHPWIPLPTRYHIFATKSLASLMIDFPFELWALSLGFFSRLDFVLL